MRAVQSQGRALVLWPPGHGTRFSCSFHTGEVRRGPTTEHTSGGMSSQQKPSVQPVTGGQAEARGSQVQSQLGLESKVLSSNNKQH